MRIKWLGVLMCLLMLSVTACTDMPELPSQEADGSSSQSGTTVATGAGVPEGWNTYTQAEVFSISYPSEWQLALDLIPEMAEITAEMLEEEALSAEDLTFLFFAGQETAEGYYPAVNLLVVPRSLGYWNLDDIVEADIQYSRETMEQFVLHSVEETEIGGLEARIVETQDWELGYGDWRYLQVYITKGTLIWLVTCSCELEDYQEWEETFHSIIRSVQIEH